MAGIRVGVDLRCLAGHAVGGWARYTAELVAVLRTTAGIDLVGLARSGDDLPDVGVEVLRQRARREIVSEQLSMARAAATAHLDVLWCPANRGLPLFAPCPTVLTLHDAVEWDPAIETWGHGRSRARFRYASIASLAAASLVIAPSELAAAGIERRLHVSRARLRVVRNGIGTQFGPEPDGSDAPVLAAHGLDPGYVLYLGSFHPKKDVATLLAAIPLLPAGTRLVLAGGIDEHGARLRSTVGADAAVRWLGAIDDADLPALYRGAAVFAFPSVAEGFGLPPLEAMACGTPVVAADAGSLPEVLGDGAVLVAPRDPRALADALRVLLTDPAVRDAGRARALDRAARYSWAESGAATAAVLREAAALSMPREARRRALELRHAPSWFSARQR